MYILRVHDVRRDAIIIRAAKPPLIIKWLPQLFRPNLSVGANLGRAATPRAARPSAANDNRRFSDPWFQEFGLAWLLLVGRIVGLA
jgi:hypothetical protein